MSVRHVSWVLDHSPAKNGERLVLLAVANHADEADEAWPSEACLAHETNLSRGQVRRIVGRCVEAGWLVREVNAAPDERIRADQRPNLYRLVMVSDRPTWSEVRAERARAIRPPAPSDGRAQSDERARAIRVDGRAQSASTGARNPRAEPSLELSLEPPVNPPSRGAAFEAFWGVYPRRVAKDAARRAFDTAAKRADPDVILRGARRYADDPNLPPEQFIPHPSTWLNGGRWDDGPLAARNGGPPPPPDAGIIVDRDGYSGAVVEDPETGDWVPCRT